MSTEIHDEAGVIVVRLAGPADEGDDRRRWQITVLGEQTTLRADQVRALAEALARSLYEA